MRHGIFVSDIHTEIKYVKPLQENKEIKALLHLIDDPDEEIYHTVSEKIVSLGKDIIPNLEELWENINNESIQERIESLIHKLHFRDLQAEFSNWLKLSPDLLSGSIIVAKYHYPDIQPNSVLQEIEKLRRNVWLELNNYLTPIERINVLNSIFYNYYKQKGLEISYQNPDHFLINKALETKTGNSVSNGIIYLILCNLLDIPVRAVNIPRQFLLGYFDEHYQSLQPVGHSSQKILFYIEPSTGQLYSNNDIDKYFKTISVSPSNAYFRPCSNQKVIKHLLEELSKCFDNDQNRYKMDELLLIAKMMEE